MNKTDESLSKRKETALQDSQEKESVTWGISGSQITVPLKMLCAEKLDEGLGSSGFSSKCCEIETKVIFWLIKTGEAKQSKYSTSTQARKCVQVKPKL